MENKKTNYLAVWEVAYSHLKRSLPEHAIGAWFEPLKPVELSGNELILEVPNQFFCEWIDSHYKKHLLTALNKESNNKNSSYRFIINNNSKKVKPEPLLQQQQNKNTNRNFNNINKQYTFNNFIEGSNNEFAKSASLSVSQNPGQNAFNPLIIYGGVGLGKTHLMHAIGNQATIHNPKLNIVIVTSEKFTLDFVNSLRKNKTIEFTQRYRSADILMVDDIQFFRGKEQTQEQFFHTFNALHQSGKQIVMTTDKYPGEMKGLQARLLSRFQSGLSVDVQPPNFEVRVAILLEKAEQNGILLDYDVIEFIARNITDNIRDLEGTIIRILAKSSLLNKEIDSDLVRGVVRERTSGGLKTNITIEDIVKKVSMESFVKEKDIVGKSRKMEIAEARQMSMYLCREIMGISLSNIGVYFGGRDHTTVLHSIKKITNKCENNTGLNNTIKSLRRKLTNPA